MRKKKLLQLLMKPFFAETFSLVLSEAFTLLAVDALVGGAADAESLDAGAVVGAGGVDALALLHVALRPLPARQAHAAAFLIDAVAAAQHGAGVCERKRERAPLITHWAHVCESARTNDDGDASEWRRWTERTCREPSDALLSQPERRFSKSLSCLPLFTSLSLSLFLSLTYTHTQKCIHICTWW